MKTDKPYQHAVILCLLAQELLKGSEAPHTKDLLRGIDTQLWMYEPANFTRTDYNAIATAIAPVTGGEKVL